MPVIYQLYETVQTYADEEEQNIINEKEMIENKKKEELKKLEEQLKKEEEDLLQNETYTPVTPELFKEWYTKFIAEQHSKIIKRECDKRLSGREYFLNRNLKLEDNKEENEDNIEKEIIEDNKEDKISDEEYEAEVFEEDINNIDFDNDDNIEDL